MKLKKQLLLFTWSLLVVAGFFALPQNREWLMKKPGAYWGDFLRQKSKPSLEYRREKRWEGSYTYSKAIADSFRTKTGSGAELLVPPTTYFKHYGIDYHVPEPAVFYYYTGVKTVWANSAKAADARWYLRVQGGRMVIDSITDRAALKDTIAAFQKFGVAL